MDRPLVTAAGNPATPRAVMCHHAHKQPKKDIMQRWFLPLAILVATLIASTTVAPAGRAGPTTSQDAPIGRLGDTLRVSYDDPVVGPITADVTVHDVVPSEIPPGWGWNGAPRWRAQGAPWRANVTVRPIKVPTPYILATALNFNGVAPGADAYPSKHTDDPTALDVALTNAPQGSTVTGGVYWDVYRGLVTNVVLTSRNDGTHLAQWNLPG